MATAFATVVIALLLLMLDEFTSPSGIGAGFMLSTERRQRLAAKARLRQRLRPLYYVMALVGIAVAFFSSK